MRIPCYNRFDFLSFPFFFSWDRISLCVWRWPRTHAIAQVNHELIVVIPDSVNAGITYTSLCLDLAILLGDAKHKSVFAKAGCDYNQCCQCKGHSEARASAEGPRDGLVVGMALEARGKDEDWVREIDSVFIFRISFQLIIAKSSVSSEILFSHLLWDSAGISCWHSDVGSRWWGNVFPWAIYTLSRAVFGVLLQ